ncbi:MAG: histidine--tRNA ligase [Nitrososphaerota archaeon]
MFETPRGMDDLLPDEVRIKRRVEDVIREVYRLYGYEEVETPTVEYLSLFEAKSGEEIRHRMFRMVDAHGRTLVLRPEVTASIARLVATKLARSPTPIRLGYIADCYRYDEPQWGRRRRFWHGGLELFGSSDPMSDSEITLASLEVFRRLGIDRPWVRFGHVGIVRGILTEEGLDEKTQDIFLTMLDRKMQEEAFQSTKSLIDADAEKTLRLLIQMRGGVEIFRRSWDLLSPWSSALRANENFEEIVGMIRHIQPELVFTVDYGFARGLEYYTGFIFEQGVGGVDISFNGGGRYDRLVSLFGGSDTPAVGCAIGITRLVTYLHRGTVEMEGGHPTVLLSVLSDGARAYALSAAESLRQSGIATIVDVTRKRIPDAIELALKKHVRYLAVVGEREHEHGTITIRDLSERRQTELTPAEAASYIKGGRPPHEK